MEIIKKIISLEQSTSRDPNNNYGVMTATTFYAPIHIKQTFDDMGLFTDMPFIPAPPLQNPPDGIFDDIRPPGTTVDMYYDQPITVTGTTDDRWLLEVKSDVELTPYIPLLNQAEDITIRFDGVIASNSSKVDYVIGGDVDTSAPQPYPYIAGTGIMYTTYLNEWVNNIDDEKGNVDTYKRTTFSFTSIGRNENNTSLSALTKEEEFLGVVFPQEVQSEVFIERGGEDIFEKHMIMAEIKTVDDINRYRNGYLVNINV